MNRIIALPGYELRGLASVAVLVCAISMTSVASAQLSEVDLVPGSGDAAVTLDGATGLYWLDLTLTTDLSVPDVLGGAGGWVASGWRYATASEICALFATYALAVPSCGGNQGGSASGDVVGTLQGFVGITGTNPLIRFTAGLYDDGGDLDRVGVGRLVYDSPIDTSTSLVDNGATPATAASSTIGNWLVRDDPPPPPPPVPALSGPLGGALAALLTALAASRVPGTRRS